MSKKPQRVTVYLSRDLWKRARLESIKAGVSASSLVEAGLKLALESRVRGGK